jgi:myo-inositol-1(or 4)-monophosphatase
VAANEIDEDELLGVAVAAARAAGDELLSRFRTEPVALRSKSTPTDPVSAADEAAEAAIRAVLARERPRDSILGEEGGATGGAERGHGLGESGLRWVVDPLDGTVNYLYGIPEFAVSVACEDADGGVVGVVLAPVSGELFAAGRSARATLDGDPIRPSGCEELSRALVATGFAYDPQVRAAQARVLLELLPAVRDVRRAGAAALDLCAVACGRVDAYYERGLKEWDVAAGSLICRRVGLEVRRLTALNGLPCGLMAASGALTGPLQRLVA